MNVFLYDEAWQARYGSRAPSNHERLAPFLSHRSIRKFSDQEVDLDTVTALVACAQSAATSSHLQLWSLISVQNPEQRAAIQAVAANYEHVGTAPWFFIFIADTYRLKQCCEEGGDALDRVEYFTMAVVDASLAAERMACAAESLGLGICYIGAVRNDVAKIAQILDLPEGTFPVFGFCLGYPQDPLPEIKPRLGQPQIWFREAYNREVSVAEFDERMREHYTSRGQSPSVTWSQRSCRRTDEVHLTGRDALKVWLENQGLNRR